jgi:tetratricopeptide (TPR) repeat protein
LAAVERGYHDLQGHFLLGRALQGLKDYARAADAYRLAIACNPNFPAAHLRLARLLEQRLGAAEAAGEHYKLARAMQRRRRADEPNAPVDESNQEHLASPIAPSGGFADDPVPSISESLIVVTGLPRSGTSLVMQMLAGGGLPVLADEARPADQDNPRGYFEFAPVKRLAQSRNWLAESRGKAVKIVSALLAAIPPELPCHVLVCQRDLDEVLDSQERMLARHDAGFHSTPERRLMLKQEYRRILRRTERLLARRSHTRSLAIEYDATVADPHATAVRIRDFLGGQLDTARMAAAVDPMLHRNRRRERQDAV